MGEKVCWGGNSGSGSYNRLAQFKADTINDFLIEHTDIKTCIEWGCGDGNQLSLIDYPMYTGVDVSLTIINKNRDKFCYDKNKEFFESGEFMERFKGRKYDMSISLDVIFHLVEDEVFNQYMDNLFSCSRKYVCIYSNNYERPYNSGGEHVKDRVFTDWIEQNIRDYELIKFVKQKYPSKAGITDTNTSACDFYFYELKG